MAKRKLSSTNYTNRKKLLEVCPILVCYDLIAGRWKTHVIWALRNRPLRFNEIRKSIPDATERMIARRLLELVESKVIRISETDLHKSYHLTLLGERLVPLLENMFALGEKIKKKPDWVLSESFGTS